MGKNRKGFTLLELAIVLVVIGLLIALVVRGVVLTRGARVKRVASDLRSIHTAVMIYYERNNAYPGDTDGDGLIDDNAQAWNDLASQNIAYQKPNPFGGTYDLGNDGTHNTITFTVDNTTTAQEIDNIIDDGDITTGALTFSGTTGTYIMD